MGARLAMIDRHYGHLARDGGDHAVALLDAYARDSAAWTPGGRRRRTQSLMRRATPVRRRASFESEPPGLGELVDRFDVVFDVDDAAFDDVGAEAAAVDEWAEESGSSEFLEVGAWFG